MKTIALIALALLAVRCVADVSIAAITPPMPDVSPAVATPAQRVVNVVRLPVPQELPARGEGIAAVLERREMRRAERKETSRKVDGKEIVREWSDGTETRDPIQYVATRKEVAKAVLLVRARDEALMAVKDAGRAKLKDGAKATEIELLALGSEREGKDIGGVAGGVLAGVLAGIGASKLIGKQKEKLL